jgi:hypothetical protein
MLLCYTTQIAAYRPLLAVLEGTLLTSREVGTHLRYSPEQMSNLRRRSAKGPPWFKLPSGAVRYDAAEVMAWQIGSASGPLTMARVTLAISACAAVPLEHRAAIIEHVQKALVAE